MASRRASQLHVVFAVAAGASTGFGHLIRCGHLASELGARRSLALRGSEHALWTAIRLGWTVHRGAPGDVLACQPDLLVVDDPSPRHIERWVNAARRAGVPVATIRDGVGAPVSADLVIDGSFAVGDAGRSPRGPRWAILDPRVELVRDRRHQRHGHRVLIALGGGRHTRSIGVGIARDLRRLNHDVAIDIAAGFVDTHRRPVLPARCAWLSAPDGLADALARAPVAIVAGGVTLHEACALGTAVVAVPVVPAQRPAVRAAARLGVAFAATESTAAAAAVRLLSDRPLASGQARRALRTVDGRGRRRAADALRALISHGHAEGLHDAA